MATAKEHDGGKDLSQVEGMRGDPVRSTKACQPTPSALWNRETFGEMFLKKTLAP